MRDSHQWVLAGKAMKESAERMDAALSLAGKEEQGRKVFEGFAPVCERFLGHKGASVWLPGEGEVADRIKLAEERYQDLANKFWNASDLGTRRTMYAPGLLPLFTEIHNELQEVIGVNDVNTVRVDQQARTLSANSTRTMFVVWAVGLGIVVSIYFATQRAIFKPIGILTTVAKELGNGNLDQEQVLFDLPAISKGAKA